MDLNIFATQTVQASPLASNKSSSAVIAGDGLLGGANGLGDVNADFWNVILGNLAGEQTETSDKELGSDTNPEKIKKETVDLALLQLALLGQDPDVNIDDKLAELRIERQNLSHENRIEQLTKLIDHLTNGLPEATNENTTVEELVARLTKRLESLESNLEAFRTGDFGDEGAPFQLLIATGLNPAQLTRITSRIEEVETKLGRKLTVEDLIAGVGNIVPAPGDDDHEFSTTDAMGILLAQSDKNENLSKKPAAELDKTLDKTNANKKASSEKTQSENENKLGNLSNTDTATALQGAPTGTTANESQSTTTAPIDELPQQLSNSEFNTLFSSKNAAKENFAKLNIANLAQKSALPTLPTIGDISFPTSWTETFSAQNTLSDALGFDIQTGAPFNATMLAAHSASSIPQAGQTHSATQMVAAHISKAAQNGETKNITLKLDPPELGRVEVRLEFGKDKSVKAHMVVEKPETLLMLQRDASALERALQNAGLETDSSSLNYQMADNSHAFDSNGREHGQGGQAGNSASNSADAGDEDLIETTLTWDIDAETGHVRYNLIA